jgi:hypothetical protein
MPLAGGAREITTSTMTQRHNRKAAAKVRVESHEFRQLLDDSNQSQPLLLMTALRVSPETG